MSGLSKESIEQISRYKHEKPKEIIKYKSTGKIITKNVVHKSDINLDGAITFYWGPQMEQNGCSMSSASITLGPDGTVYFSANTTSDNTDNYFYVQEIQLFDEHGLNFPFELLGGFPCNRTQVPNVYVWTYMHQYIRAFVQPVVSYVELSLSA